MRKKRRQKINDFVRAGMERSKDDDPTENKSVRGERDDARWI